MKFNSYTLTARIFPAILSAIPFFALHFYYLRPILGEFWNELLGFQVVTDVTLSLVFLFLLLQLNRLVAKELFEKRFFQDGLYLPTTDFLIHLDSYFSPEYTRRIHAKITNDFGITIPSLREESENPNRSRSIIKEVMGLIRNKIAEGRLVSQHNAEYGFFRNLVGGAFVALVMSIANIIIFWSFEIDGTAIWVSAVSSFIYLIIVLFGKKIITFAGRGYAKILIEEYMSQ